MWLGKGKLGAWGVLPTVLRRTHGAPSVPQVIDSRRRSAQARPTGLWGFATVGLALVAALLLVWVFLRFAGAIQRFLHNSGTVLLTRVAGMLLAAIAVQMLADGVLAFLRQV